jgi:four helix bundle protein
MDLAAAVYQVSAKFPKAELYGLTSQIRRAAVSVPSNIAEGKGHYSDKELLHFLYHARGSLLEVETQVLLAQRLQYLTAPDAEVLLNQAQQVGRALTGLINACRGEKATSAGQ